MIPDAVKRAVYVRTCAERFEIDERILVERINRTRTDMIIADKRQAERERQRASSARTVVSDGQQQDVPPPAVDDYVDYGTPVDVYAGPAASDGIVLNAPTLAPCEKELLGFILEDGCTVLKFDRDSKYYDPDETVNVAEFIDGAIQDDYFVNTSFAKVYDEYFRMYDEGLEQRQIQTRLLNSQDPEIAAVAKELLIEKYQITVKAFENSLTTNDTRLVIFVPKSLMTYQCKKVEAKVKELAAELESAADPERQIEIMARIDDLNRARTRLNNELGRV